MLDFGHPWYRIFGQFLVRIQDNPYGDFSVIGLWFVIALMVCRLLSGDIKKFSFVQRYRYVSLIFLLIWLTIEPNIWDNFPVKDFKFYLGIYALPFFMIGYVVKDLNIRIDSFLPLLILVMACIYSAITLSHQRIDMLNYQYGTTYLLFFFSALCGSFVLYWICTKLPRLKIVEVFSIGTLFILFLHMELDFFLLPVFHRLGLTPSTTYLSASLLPWFEMVIEFTIFYFPIKWMNNHFPILLGKMHKR